MTKSTNSSLKLRLKNLIPFFLTLLGTILSFILTIILSRSLGKQQYGQIQYWLGIINTFSAFSAFGIPNFLIRDGHLYEDKKKFFTQCLFIILIINLIALPAFFLISYFAFSELNKNILIIVVIILTSLSTAVILILQYQYLLLNKKSFSILVSSVLIKAGLIIVSTFLLIFNLESVLFKYYVYLYFGVYLLVLLPPLIKNFKPGLPRFNKAQYFSMLIFLLISVCSGTNNQISKILLGEAGKGDYSIVAIYSLCVQIITIVSTFNTLVVTLVRPKFAELYTQNEIESLIKLYRSSLRVTCRVAIPFFVAFAIQQNLVFGIFGDNYGGFPLIMILLVLAQLYADITGPSGTLMAMSHIEKKELLINVLQFAIFLGVSIGLLKHLYYAIPLALFISYFVSYSLRAISIYKKHKFLVFDIRSLIEIAVELSASIGTFLLLNLIESSTIKIILDIICGCVLLALFNFLPLQKKDLDYYLENI